MVSFLCRLPAACLGSYRAHRAASSIDRAALLPREHEESIEERRLRIGMSTLAEVPPVKHKREVIERAEIRFAGDSGDGMQITGSPTTNTGAPTDNDSDTHLD